MKFFIWILFLAMICSGFTCSKNPPRERLSSDQQRAAEREEREQQRAEEHIQEHRLKKISDEAPRYGLYRYEDDEVVCYVYERSESGSLSCHPKKKVTP